MPADRTRIGGQSHVLRVARVMHRDGPNVTLEVFTDDNYEIQLNDGDEFWTVWLPERVL